MAWNYPLSFDPKEPFCIVYGLSCPRKGGVEIPSSFTKQGFALLCPYHDYYLDYCYKYYLKVFARDKVLLFTLFLLLLPFWRAKRRLIVNILTGAHLSLVSGDVYGGQSQESTLKPTSFCTMKCKQEANCKCLNLRPSISYLRNNNYITLVLL